VWARASTGGQLGLILGRPP